MGRLEGKIAIVTGAARGIGQASAKAMAAEGAKVLLADINGEGAQAAAAEIEALGGTAAGHFADVSQEDQVEAMIAAALQRWGRLDVLMNNAHSGQSDDIDIVTTSRDAWDRVFAGTLFGVVYGCKHAIPAMLKTGGGSIINVSSNATLGGDFIRVAYGAAKSGVISVTKYAATAYGQLGIRCNILSPGVLVTPAVLNHYPPLMREIVAGAVLSPRMGTPEDAAGLVVYLASDESSFINGQTISVDGGLNTHLGLAIPMKKANIVRT